MIRRNILELRFSLLEDYYSIWKGWCLFLKAKGSHSNCKNGGLCDDSSGTHKNVDGRWRKRPKIIPFRLGVKTAYAVLKGRCRSICISLHNTNLEATDLQDNKSRNRHTENKHESLQTCLCLTCEQQEQTLYGWNGKKSIKPDHAFFYANTFSQLGPLSPNLAQTLHFLVKQGKRQVKKDACPSYHHFPPLKTCFDYLRQTWN